MLPRHLQAHLETLLAHFPCVVLTGVRQCGKTTLLGTLPGTWQHFDMENSADRQQLLADPDLFLRLHPNRLVIDEAQLAPPLFSALRVAIDRDRSKKGRFLLSGSSSPELARQMSESLAGRVARIELAPLSLAEAWQLPASSLYRLLTQNAPMPDILAAAAARLTVQQVQDYWFAGGYPEPWLSDSEEFRSLWARHYIDSYLLRDIGALFPNLNRDRFRQFITLLSQHSGNILNNADIARTLGVSEPTVRDWLGIAHDTFLWRHIPAWDRSTAKQLVKHPKGFLRDSGLFASVAAHPGHHAAGHPSGSWQILGGHGGGNLAQGVRKRRDRGAALSLPNPWWCRDRPDSGRSIWHCRAIADRNQTHTTL